MTVLMILEVTTSLMSAELRFLNKMSYDIVFVGMWLL